MIIDDDIKNLKDEVVQHRRWLHMHPGLGFEVEESKEYIYNVLTRLEFDRVEEVCGTGIKGVIYAKNPQRTFAFRADMDALPVSEETGLKFSSQYKGKMHACGHDGHMAIMLGFAKWLAVNREKLQNNIVLIFQPAEETVGGARAMIEAGVLENPKVDGVFGFHIMPEIQEGHIGVKKGVLMAQNCEFDIKLWGKSAHGAMAHLGADCILAAAQLITSIQGIVTRRVDAKCPAIISIGKLVSGTARNVVANKADMEGMIRTFDDNVYETIKESILGLIESLKKSYGVDGEYIETVYYPPVINHDEWTQRIIDIIPDNKLYTINEPLMISEDFSYFQKEVPGVFMFLGSRNENEGLVAPLHSSRFNFNEEILLTGIQLCKQIVTSPIVKS